MNRSLRIVINTRWPKHSSARRLFFDDLADNFHRLGHEVEVDNWTDYARFDVAILRSTDVEISNALKANPGLLIGLVKPQDDTRAHTHETQRADFIISGSIEERDYYLQYNPNIFILHHIEKERGPYKQHEEKDEITLSYHGNLAHLEQFYPFLQLALEALAAKYVIRLKVVYNIRELGGWTIGRPRIPIIEVQWDLDTVAAELAETDIGLVPSLTPIIAPEKQEALRGVLGERGPFQKAPNDYLIRFKNNSNAGRAFVFMQLGIPVVADMTPECCQAVFHGWTGFLAHSAEGWYDAIERLILDARLRQEMADNARALLGERFDRKRNVEALAEYMVARLAEKRGSVPPRRIAIQERLQVASPPHPFLGRLTRWLR